MTDAAVTVMELRQTYWRNGYRPVAIYTKQKRPIGNGWRADAFQDPPMWVTRWPDEAALSTGIATGTLAGIDVDVLDQQVVDHIVIGIERLIETTPLLRIGKAPKTLMGYRCEHPFTKQSTEVFLMPDGSDAKVEVLADGQQFVADGIHPDTGKPYSWPSGSPDTVPLAQVPEITLEQAQTIIDMAAGVLRAHGAVPKPKKNQKEHKGNSTSGDGFFAQVNVAALRGLGSWVKALFPQAVYQKGTGAYRVASKDRGRPELEEDISFHPDGIQDFGEEYGLSAIDVVLRHGDAPDALGAAFWLCERLSISPSELGWHQRINGSSQGAKKQAPKGENGSETETEETDPYEAHELPTVEWIDRRISDWDENELPERLWIVPDWIPREQVTGLYGPPGVNKTDFLIQLMLATSAGLPFLGYQLAPMPVFGLFCEDTAVEIARRAARIARHYGMHLNDFPQFHYASLVGYDDLEFVTFDKNSMFESRALKRFDMKIAEVGAAFACLDTAPHFFGGSEIDRRQVSRFLRKLDAISIKRGCGIMITAHPSARGRSSGRMDSGSTGWEGGVRARIALTKPEPDLGPEDGSKPPEDTKDRALTLWKSNYAPPGKVLDLVCERGVFTTAALDPQKAKARGPQAKQACEERFLELVRKSAQQGRHVNDSANHPARYAPKVFAAMPDGQPFSVPEFKRAMERLFSAGKLRQESDGRHIKLVEVATTPNNQTST